MILTKSIDDRLISGTQTALYSTQNHTDKIYVRNINCWAYGIDLSCASPWNSDLGTQKAGTLITPRHVIYATHYSHNIPCTIRFVGMNNQCVDRTIVAARHVPDSDDITVGILNEDVPSYITFAKILPANWQNYINNNEPLPLCQLDQYEKATVANVSSISTLCSDCRTAPCIPYMCFTCTMPLLGIRASYYINKTQGDSGNPVFLIWNNQPIILGCLFGGGSGGGPSIVDYKTQINQTLSLLNVQYNVSTNYQLTPISFTPYLSKNAITSSFHPTDSGTNMLHLEWTTPVLSSSSSSGVVNTYSVERLNTFENMEWELVADSIKGNSFEYDTDISYPLGDITAFFRIKYNYFWTGESSYESFPTLPEYLIVTGSGFNLYSETYNGSETITINFNRTFILTKDATGARKWKYTEYITFMGEPTELFTIEIYTDPGQHSFTIDYELKMPYTTNCSDAVTVNNYLPQGIYNCPSTQSCSSNTVGNGTWIVTSSEDYGELGQSCHLGIVIPHKPTITNFKAIDLGNGSVRLTWDKPDIGSSIRRWTDEPLSEDGFELWGKLHEETIWNNLLYIKANNPFPPTVWENNQYRSDYYTGVNGYYDFAIRAINKPPSNAVDIYGVGPISTVLNVYISGNEGLIHNTSVTSNTGIINGTILE